MGSAIEKVERPVTAMEMMQQVLSSGLPASEMALIIKEFVALRQSEERFAWEREERQTRIDFDGALNEVQDAIGWVAKDVERSDGKGKYASFEALDGELRPVYLKAGFAISFDADPHPPDGKHIVIAYVSRRGFTRTYHHPVLIDPNGPKGNPVMTLTDAANAAHSKGCRILLGRIFNIATGEKEINNISPDDANELDGLIRQMKDSASIEDCREAYRKAYVKARETKNSEATLSVIDVYEKCQKEFAK